MLNRQLESGPEALRMMNKIFVGILYLNIFLAWQVGFSQTVLHFKNCSYPLNYGDLTIDVVDSCNLTKIYKVGSDGRLKVNFKKNGRYRICNSNEEQLTFLQFDTTFIYQKHSRLITICVKNVLPSKFLPINEDSARADIASGYFIILTPSLDAIVALQNQYLKERSYNFRYSSYLSKESYLLVYEGIFRYNQVVLTQLKEMYGENIQDRILNEVIQKINGK